MTCKNIGVCKCYSARRVLFTIEAHASSLPSLAPSGRLHRCKNSILGGTYSWVYQGFGTSTSADRAALLVTNEIVPCEGGLVFDTLEMASEPC